MASALNTSRLPSDADDGAFSQRSIFKPRLRTNERSRQRQERIMRVMENARGSSLSAIEINQRLGQQGALLVMSALHRDLKQLTVEGLLRHGWITHGDRISSAYCVDDARPAELVRLECSICGSTVAAPTGLLSRLVSEACSAQGMPIANDSIEIELICHGCEPLLPAAATPLKSHPPHTGGR